MKNKIYFSFIILITLFFAISAISASEDINDNTISVLDDNSPSVVSQDGVEDNSPSTISQGAVGDSSSSVVSQGAVEDSSPSSDSQTTEEDVKDSSDSQTEELDVKNSSDDEDNVPSTGTSQKTTTSKYRTSIKVAKNNVTYHEGSVKAVFKLRLLDGNNNPLSGKKITIKVCGKKYTAKTSSKGYATFYLSNLKKGTRIVKFSFSKSGKYLSCKGSTKIKVKSKLTQDNGYWVDNEHLFKLNLKKLSKRGTKHIFILSSAFTTFGEKKVLKWIKKAHKYDIKVHVWICTFCYNGHFYPPAYKNGAYNYKRMNFVLKKVKHLANLKQIDGIHFDYLRYSGTAYKYKNGVKAVNYFVKKAAKIIRKKNNKTIISAAVMAEPSSMKRFYAQDIPTISKHFDVIIPMVYKGNYRSSTKWIKRTTKQFKKMSKGAQIWSGLQAYKSDRNLRKLTYKSLRRDAINAKKGGASGVILFKYGLSRNLNFNKL